MFSIISAKSISNDMPYVIWRLIHFSNDGMSNQESTHDAASLPDLLLMYYKRLFPYKALFRWFNYGGGT